MKNTQHTPKFRYAEISGTPMPPEQTGVYSAYTTVCEGGSDKVIREIARFYFMPNNSFGVTPNFS